MITSYTTITNQGNMSNNLRWTKQAIWRGHYRKLWWTSHFSKSSKEGRSELMLLLILWHRLSSVITMHSQLKKLCKVNSFGPGFASQAIYKPPYPSDCWGHQHFKEKTCWHLSEDAQNYCLWMCSKFLSTVYHPLKYTAIYISFCWIITVSIINWIS